jgi:hypothetical protein
VELPLPLRLSPIKEIVFGTNETSCQHCGQMILWSKAELYPESVIKERFPNLRLS